MNDNLLDDKLKECFHTKFTMDEHFRADMQQKLYEKQERRNNFLLCFIQVAMFVLTFSIIAVIFMISRRTMLPLLLTGYILVSGFISVIVVVLHSKNNMIIRRA